MKEALAGGPAALDARDSGIAQSTRVIEAELSRASAEMVIPDVPVEAVIGAIHRLLATRLRRGERVLGGLLEDLLAWLESYGSPAGEQRWRTLRRAPAPAPSPFLPRTPLRAPPPLGPGRPRMSEEEVAENHRQRIMFATASSSSRTRLHGDHDRRDHEARGRRRPRLLPPVRRQAGGVQRHPRARLSVPDGRHRGRVLRRRRAGPSGCGRRFVPRRRACMRTPTIAHVGFVEAYAVGPRGDPARRGQPHRVHHLPAGGLPPPGGGSAAVAPRARGDRRDDLRDRLPRGAGEC